MPPIPAITARCRFLEAVDGDTFKAEIRLIATVRLCGEGDEQCWVPELDEPGGQEALAYVKQLEGQDGIIQIPTEKAHNLASLFSFGRLLANWWKEGEEEDLASKLVRLGFASSRKGGRLGE
jgi:hypothetical protein